MDRKTFDWSGKVGSLISLQITLNNKSLFTFSVGHYTNYPSLFTSVTDCEFDSIIRTKYS